MRLYEFLLKRHNFNFIVYSKIMTTEYFYLYKIYYIFKN